MRALTEVLERPLWVFEGHLFKVAALCYPCMSMSVFYNSFFIYLSFTVFKSYFIILGVLVHWVS